VVQLRICVPKGFVDLAERSFRGAMDVAGDFMKIGLNVVAGSEHAKKAKVKKVDIK
jgi:hypothetical protein